MDDPVAGWDITANDDWFIPHFIISGTILMFDGCAWSSTFKEIVFTFGTTVFAIVHQDFFGTGEIVECQFLVFNDMKQQQLIHFVIVKLFNHIVFNITKGLIGRKEDRPRSTR